MASRVLVRKFQTDAGTGVFDFTGNGNSRSEDVEELSDITVQIGGTFTATIQVQGAIGDGPWANVGSSIAAAGFIQVAGTYSKLRIVITGFTIGPVNAWLAGRETRIGQ